MSIANHITDRMSDVEKIDALIALLADYTATEVDPHRPIRQNYGTGREPLSHAKAALVAMRADLTTNRPSSSTPRRCKMAFVLGILFSFSLLTPRDVARIGGFS